MNTFQTKSAFDTCILIVLETMNQNIQKMHFIQADLETSNHVQLGFL